MAKAVEEHWGYREERSGYNEGNSLRKAVADSGSQNKSPVPKLLLRASPPKANHHLSIQNGEQKGEKNIKIIHQLVLTLFLGHS